jgi:ATP-dependent Lon protease
MTESLIPATLSAVEKLSLKTVQARLTAKKHPSTGPEPVHAKDSDACAWFSAQKAEALSSELLAQVGYPNGGRLHEFFVSLLRSLPQVEGSALKVVDTHYEALLVSVDALGDAYRTLTATASQVLHMAKALHQNPSLVPWYDLNVVLNEKERLNGMPPGEQTDAEREYLRFIVQIERSGPLRHPCAIPSPRTLLQLVDKFPNFEAPVHFLAEQAALARLRRDARFHVIPILLTGPAGIGKTHFALALAEVFGTSMEVISMASQSCGFAIAGMDRGWSSARAGLVFEALRQSTSMSPLIVLDEIDKSNCDSRSDPMGPLYSLLEPRMSRTFRDEYAGVPVNASQVLWIATANDASNIPAPLLSRFKVFDIADPTATQLSCIAAQVYEEMAANLPGIPSQLPQSWLRKLEGRSIRDIRIALQQALGKAALRAAMAEQVAVNISEYDVPALPVNGRRQIGF